MIEKNKRKGELTRASILNTALQVAGCEGLEGLTIGSLAEKMHMSKSGVFAHFGSREELQLAVLHLYQDEFTREVFFPSLQKNRGLPRLRSLFALWVQRVTVEISSGCIFISGASEYDDKACAVRDALFQMVNTWQDALRRAVLIAIEEGHIQAQTDPDQIVYEMYGLVMALHHDARFLKKAGSASRAEIGFERMIYTLTPAFTTEIKPTLKPSSEKNKLNDSAQLN